MTWMRGRSLAPVMLALIAAACGSGGAAPADEGPGTGPITVYSGREQELVEPVFKLFTDATGIEVNVRYGDTAELAAQILEEGGNTPADVFFAQDAGGLGAVAEAGMFALLPNELLERVPDGFRAADGSWVGITGRARTVVYNTEQLTDADLPGSIMDFTDPKWKGKIGWAPTNGSFQAFVTGLRLLKGDEAARGWLRGIKANDPVEYPKNTAIVEAVGAGEILAGFVNHYYLLRIKAENPTLPAENLFIGGGDPGALVNVAGAGILQASDDRAAAGKFIDFLLSTQGQAFFVTETFEYPLIAGVAPDPALQSLEQLEPPALDLAKLSDLEATLEMLADEGLL